MNFHYPKSVLLANLPTPIEKLQRLTEFIDGPDIYVKRDDLTGAGLSGNKVRKLEFVLAQAIAEGADTVITCGGVQSNHARATAIAAARLGLRAHLVLRGEPEFPPDGNLLLDRLVDAEVSFVTPEDYAARIDEIMMDKVDELKAKGCNAFVIQEGASDELGAMGYVKAAQETMSQLDELGITIDHVFCATGSGGTQAGLIIGKSLYGWNAQIHGVNVCDDEEYFVKKIGVIIETAVKRFRLPESDEYQNINIIDGYVGQGYGLSSKEEIELIHKVAVLEGIILDPVYTGKAMMGLADQIRKKKFVKGEKVLFIHTGGIFGLFPQKLEFAKVLQTAKA